MPLCFSLILMLLSFLPLLQTSPLLTSLSVSPLSLHNAISGVAEKALSLVCVYVRLCVVYQLSCTIF